MNQPVIPLDYEEGTTDIKSLPVFTFTDSSNHTQELSAGKTEKISGYEILETLYEAPSKGTLIYLGQNLSTKELVAIKRISIYDDIETVNREIETLKFLSTAIDPSVPGGKRYQCRPFLLCLDGLDSVKIVDDYYYIVTKYYPGYTESLTLVAEEKTTYVPRPHEVVVNIIANMVLGLEMLHEIKIAHRDIKPENILIGPVKSTTENTDIKYIDFGFSCFNAECTKALVYRGTLAYMAPEIFKLARQSQYGFSLEQFMATDLWSLGITIYEIITGASPAQLNTQRYPFSTMQRMMIRKYPSPDVGYLSFFHSLWTYLNPDSLTYEEDLMVEKFMEEVSGKLGRTVKMSNLLNRDPTKRRLFSDTPTQ